MNKLKYLWLMATIAGLGLVSCDNKIEPAEVNTPRSDINTEALTTYKNSILSRPIVMAMHYNWGADEGSGAQLYRLPDYLDVVVAKEARHELLGWMEKDLAATQSVKQTKVLNAIDYHEIDTRYAQELNTKVRRMREKIKASWESLPEPPTPEEQAEQLATAQQTLTEECHSRALDRATKDTEEQLTAISRYGFDGVSVKLPESFELLTKEEVVALLQKVTAVAGGNNKPLLVIETPFEEARAEIERATWIVFSRKVLEHRLSDFDNEAMLWRDNRYIPSVGLQGKDKSEGFMDETHFTLKDLPRTESILYWQAPNKAGVAYYHTELDATTIVETMPYGTLSTYIDKLRVLNK